MSEILDAEHDFALGIDPGLDSIVLACSCGWTKDMGEPTDPVAIQRAMGNHRNDVVMGDYIPKPRYLRVRTIPLDRPQYDSDASGLNPTGIIRPGDTL